MFDELKAEYDEFLRSQSGRAIPPTRASFTDTMRCASFRSTTTRNTNHITRWQPSSRNKLGNNSNGYRKGNLCKFVPTHCHRQSEWYSSVKKFIQRYMLNLFSGKRRAMGSWTAIGRFRQSRVPWFWASWGEACLLALVRSCTWWGCWEALWMSSLHWTAHIRRVLLRDGDWRQVRLVLSVKLLNCLNLSFPKVCCSRWLQRVRGYRKECSKGQATIWTIGCIQGEATRNVPRMSSWGIVCVLLIFHS